MISLWRIGTDTKDYTADDLCGEGAKISGGRWNREGLPVVYTGQSIALTVLETMAHLGVGSLPLNRYLVRIDVPADLWEARKSWTCHSAPVGWDAEPAGMVSLDLGDAWLRGQESALLVVPSVIVPEESNVLINPLHPDAARIKAAKLRKWVYDTRIRAGR